MADPHTPFTAARQLAITVALAIALLAVLLLVRGEVETYVIPAEKQTGLDGHSSAPPAAPNRMSRNDARYDIASASPRREQYGSD